ncbi:hypothetical protein ACJX0J_005305, partial [Zea mays]
ELFYLLAVATPLRKSSPHTPLRAICMEILANGRSFRPFALGMNPVLCLVKHESCFSLVMNPVSVIAISDESCFSLCIEHRKQMDKRTVTHYIIK